MPRLWARSATSCRSWGAHEAHQPDGHPGRRDRDHDLGRAKRGVIQLIGGDDSGRHSDCERCRPEGMEPEQFVDPAACQGVPGTAHAAGGTRPTGNAAKRAQGRAVLRMTARHKHRRADRQADRLSLGHVVRLSGKPFESGTLSSAIRMMSISVQMPHNPSVMSFRMPSVV